MCVAEKHMCFCTAFRARERCSELQALLEAESTEKAGGRGGGRAGVSAEASDLSDVREEDETSEEGLHRLEEEVRSLNLVREVCFSHSCFAHPLLPFPLS